MHSLFILIDLGSTDSYVTPKIVEGCGLRKKKHDKSWLVQLATRTKRKVREVVSEFRIEINGVPIVVDLNILPMGSYNSIIRMDWIE